MVSECVALITGAAGGIGGAVARRFAAGGVQLALIDRDFPEPVSDALILPADLSDAAQVADAFDAALDRLGRIDMLVNVAGMMIFKPLAEHRADDWQRLLAVNLVAPALLSGRALAAMRPGGAIVNIASVHARRTSPDVASYAASKAALVSLTRSTAIEGKPLGIRCNAILPGAIDTAMLHASPNIAAGKEVIDPADIGRPEDVAELAWFLASDAARFITGEDVVTDGGRMGWL
ncbi:SDR family NAD(P)-dependent oxidoreductase [Sphingomonas japonica]|uniref:NAD(P)-dependent dehydrogenase (Short-subunit alcohol dehydrogenase family) n=1 Tax=Sphingomonas japonica TaxID=511662 RepID=A0ABX0TXX1_9SPHN|nr:SDR family oxidoreductase [Sphingomonas japonica]NIJ22705.1 NAD(P)-dependent dehydrogenase (short-subunit alcohol dehydrogenase family) [Sphingomonas japonica]